MKLIKTLLGSPEAAVYGGLNPSQAPQKAAERLLRTPDEIKNGRTLRTLTDKQKISFPFLPVALERIEEEAEERGSRWLRRLDCIHASGCRTKQQVWTAVRAISGPMFARLDMATLCLGWLDKNGIFRLNRQRGLAEDSGLTDSRVSRTLFALEQAGYVRRKIRRIYKQGVSWVSRVSIYLRPRFFIDLGLGYQLAKARNASRKRRERQLKEADKHQKVIAMNERTASELRSESHNRANGRRRREAEEKTREDNFEYAKKRVDLIGHLLELHPDVPHSEIIKAVNQKYPPAK